MAENDSANDTPGTRLGLVYLGDNTHGGEVTVPAGQTWQIKGNVRSEDGAVIKIEDDATLQVQGNPEPRHYFISLLTPPEPSPYLTALLAPPERSTFGAWLKDQPAISLADIEPSAARSLASAGYWAERADMMQQLDSAALVAQKNQISKMLTATELPSQQFIDNFRSMSLPAATWRDIQQAEEARASVAAEALFIQQTMGHSRPSMAEELSRSLDYMGATGTTAERLLQSINTVGITGSLSEQLRQSIELVWGASTLAEFPAQQFIDALRPSAVEQMNSLLKFGGVIGSVVEQTRRAINLMGASVGIAEEARRSLEGLFLTPPELRVTQAGVLIEWEKAHRPGQRRQQPEPLAEVQVVSIIADNWRDVVSQALTNGQATPSDLLSLTLSLGKASPQQIVHWLLQQTRGSQAPPSWEVIERVALDFEQNGWRYDNMSAFGRKHGIKSRATVDRYLSMYEAATGRQVRPGQGRAKRRKGK